MVFAGRHVCAWRLQYRQDIHIYTTLSLPLGLFPSFMVSYKIYLTVINWRDGGGFYALVRHVGSTGLIGGPAPGANAFFVSWRTSRRPTGSLVYYNRKLSQPTTPNTSHPTGWRTTPLRHPRFTSSVCSLATLHPSGLLQLTLIRFRLKEKNKISNPTKTIKNFKFIH